jgi:hypothetical protein
MRVAYSKAEKALRRELLEQLNVADSELSRGQLRERLQRIRNTAIARAKESARSKDERAAEASRPKRENFATDSEFAEALELFHLDLTSKAANRVLNSGRASLRARLQAEKELEEIVFRRLRLKASNPPPQPIDCGVCQSTRPLPEPVADVTKLADETLRNDFAREKWLRNHLGQTSNGDLIASLEAEIRRRNMPLYWSVEGNHCANVDERGKPVRVLTNRVYMGEVSDLTKGESQ